MVSPYVFLIKEHVPLYSNQKRMKIVNNIQLEYKRVQ